MDWSISGTLFNTCFEEFMMYSRQKYTSNTRKAKEERKDIIFPKLLKSAQHWSEEMEDER